MNYMYNDRYEILEYNNGDCYIKDIKNCRYFFKEKYFASSKFEFLNKKEITRTWKDTLLMSMLFLAVLCLICIFYNFRFIYKYEKYNLNMYIFTFIFLIINIVLHELSHIGVLHIYNRKVGKISFKLNFIFPAIAVNTSDSYILPRYRKFFVYVAGIETNLFISIIVLMFLPAYTYLLKPVVWAIIFNLIPIGYIKSDGYHIFVNSIMNVKDLKKKKSIWSILGRGIFVICSLYFIVISLMQSLGY